LRTQLWALMSDLVREGYSRKVVNEFVREVCNEAIEKY